jgi:hypothetical protein
MIRATEHENRLAALSFARLCRASNKILTLLRVLHMDNIDVIAEKSDGEG